MYRLNFTAQRLAQMVIKRNHVGLHPGADIDRADERRLESVDVGRNHIADVNIVARLAAIAVDHRCFAGQQQRQKDCHHTGFALGRLARSVHIGITERDVRQAESLLIIRKIQLPGSLAHAVRASRPCHVILGRGKHVLLAVDRAARRSEDNFFDSRVFCRLQQGDKTDDIDARIESRVCDRMTHIHLRGMMTQCVRFDALNNVRRLRIGDIDFMELGFSVQIALLTGGKIVEDMHLVALRQISVYYIGANESRAAGDNDFHAFCSVRRARKYSIVFPNPSSSVTLGSQLRIFFALVMSG